jgi:capsular exopolysaccharide synthesis family protein
MARSRSSQYLEDDEFEDEDYGDSPRSNDASNQKMRRLLLDLLGRWYWIALGLILGFLAAGYYLSKAPKEYTATSTLLIKTQTSTVMSSDRVEDIDLRSIEAMNTTSARLFRMELLEKVASRQDVRELPGLIPAQVDWRPNWWRKRASGGLELEGEENLQVPPPQILGGMIGSWMDVSVRKYTRLLDVSVTHPVPEVAKAISDAICREFLAEMDEALTTGRTGTIDLLVAESEEARGKLQAANSALATYARALEVHRELDELEMEVGELRRIFLPAHPKMQVADSELRRLKERFISEFELAVQSPSDKAYWEDIKGELPDRSVEPEEFLRVARQQVMARIGVLKSEIDSQTSVFNSMLTRIEESSVNQEAKDSSIEISSLARMPGAASAPVAKKIYTMGAAGGGALGLAIAFLLVRLDNKFNTVAQLTGETNQTVLAAISELNSAHLASAEKTYFKKHRDEITDAYDEWDERLVFRPGCSNTSYAEMFRVLRASVSLLGDEKKRKVTLFTSALPGEGKTSTSANFALAAAGQKRRTLLIDLDLRKPSVHRAFGMSRNQEPGGITECLAGIVPVEEAVISSGAEPNLDLILGGKRAPNPGELLDTGRLTAILDWAKERYDVIVLDTAPMLAVPDTRIVAPLADNVCLVIRADYAPRGAIHRVLEVVDEDGTQLSGLVFNGFKEKRRLMGQNYSYGYYKTSRYGRAYQYGYGSYGSYGAYGADDEDDDDLPKKRKNRRRRKRR